MRPDLLAQFRPSARWVLVAFAMRQGLDEATADRAVSEVLREHAGEDVDLASASRVLDELARWPG